jgi:replicative DNA helicase
VRQVSVAEIGQRDDFERMPPHDVPAEQCVLGGMLLSKDAISDVIEVIRPADHYRPAHQIVHEAILDLYARGEPADAITVANELSRRGDLQRIGGAPYLHTLIASVPTAANAGYYARIVRERAILRRLVEAGTRIVQMGYTGDADADDLVDRAQAEVYAVTDRRIAEDYHSLSEIMPGALDEIESIGSRGGQMTGVPTGFADLDALTNGLHPGQMVVIAARPAVGKALALDTPLPTAGGWTTMGSVAVGDYLLGADGKPTRVVAATAVMVGRPCYAVEFSDGEVIVADEEHQWLTWTPGRLVPPRVVTTGEIGHDLHSLTPDRQTRHAVPSVSLSRRELAAVATTTDRPGATRLSTEPSAAGTQWRYIVAARPVLSRPVRCVQVDSADHLYLAGRSLIPTHNSALALDFARSATIRHNQPTVLFSLEMGRNEITMRLLAAEAKVPMNLMRTGQLSDDDWNRLAKRMSEVADAPLFIDDSPNMSLMEIRAKCRRLKQRHDLKMVVIDYLQLMSSPKRVENRQQEVSEMSRSLKLLAKELEVPVVALSQLNRGPEQRQDKKPMLSDLRESGCLTADTRILRADTGAEVTFDELMRDGWEGVLVWSLDERQRLVPSPVINVFESGVKDVYRLRLASGREVKATANHPFLTLGGWSPLGQLKPGDRVAIPRRLPAPVSPGLGWTEHRIGLLAHLIGDGCVIKKQPVHYTSNDPENLDFVETAAASEFGIAPRIRQTEKAGYQPGYTVTVSDTPSLRTFCKRVGVHGRRGALVTELAAQLGDRQGNPNVDSIPLEVWELVKAERIHAGLTDRQFQAAIGTNYCGTTLYKSCLSRERLMRCAEVLDSQPLRDIASSDVFWDKIVSIDPLGPQPVYDATVKETHNFVANGINVHNSIEQDADMVILLHREDAYEKESPRAGEADLIVAKHRNGPTATVTVAFQGHYSRFVDMAPG